MTKKQKALLTRIIIAAVLFIIGMVFPLEGAPQLILYLTCYIVVGWDIVWKAVTNILHGQVFDENFLMTIATIGALILGEYSEGVAVMLFYQSASGWTRPPPAWAARSPPTMTPCC